MSDNRQENTPAEIYANVRNKALEEAAVWYESTFSADDGIAEEIRRLKSKP
mgnify:CR=1 FL=1